MVPRKPFDISADLQELARTPVAVVCAGPKIILDLGLTMEYLENHGSYRRWLRYGQARLASTSGKHNGMWIVVADSPVDIANILRSRWSLGLDGGVLITNPVDKSLSLAQEEVEIIIEKSLHEMMTEGITGKAITPWLIKRLHEATKGRSLATNIELLKSNVQLAAQIACDYC